MAVLLETRKNDELRQRRDTEERWAATYVGAGVEMQKKDELQQMPMQRRKRMMSRHAGAPSCRWSTLMSCNRDAKERWAATEACKLKNKATTETRNVSVSVSSSVSDVERSYNRAATEEWSCKRKRKGSSISSLRMAMALALALMRNEAATKLQLKNEAANGRGRGALFRCYEWLWLYFLVTKVTYGLVRDGECSSPNSPACADVGSSMASG